MAEKAREKEPYGVFGGSIERGAGHVAQCAGHCACSVKACCGRFCKEAKGAEDGFEFARCGSAEHGKAGEGLGDDGIDAGGQGSGVGDPCAALGGFERKSRIEEGVVPRREDL